MSEVNSGQENRLRDAERLLEILKRQQIELLARLVAVEQELRDARGS